MDILGPEVTEHSGRSQGRRGTRDGGNQPTSDIIPMSEFRYEKGENLKKIHAQSSAETSGLGDSLQRIHTLSSTETSGYGDTVPSPTAPTPSPEAGHSRGLYTGHDVVGSDVAGEHSPVHGYGRGRSQSPSSHPAMGQDQEARRYGTATGDSPRTASRDKSKAAAHAGHNPRYTGTVGSPEFVCLAGGSTKGKRSQHARQASPPPPDLTVRFPTNAPAQSVSDNAKFHDCYPNSSADRSTDRDQTQHKPRGPRPKLQRSQDLDEGIDGEFRDMGAYSPTETPPPNHAAYNDKSKSATNFLGKETQSTWLKWSQERRHSFKKRMDSLEQRQKDMERTRVTTPVRKARKESVMFVGPNLEDTHLTPCDEFVFPPTSYTSNTPGTTPATPTVSTINTTTAVMVGPSRKARRLEQDMKMDVKLSENQLNTLSVFWEHDVFIRSRWMGILISFLAFIFGIVAATNHDWSRMQYDSGYLEVSGLWQNCSSNISDSVEFKCSILSLPDTNAGIWEMCFMNTTKTRTEGYCLRGKPYWQNAVIGLLIFSVAFGFLATILSICGVCTTQLPKKIYYYHSAGEIYLICALSCVAALVVYPVAIQVEGEGAKHSLGVGYGLGWGAAFFFLASSVCMCLDDLVRAFARGLCKTCGRDSDGDTRV